MSNGPRPRLDLLTDEEVMVLRGVAYGMTDDELAARHHRTHATIRQHYTHIVAKILPGITGGNKRVLLTRIAIAAGYVSLPVVEPSRSE
mgnify:CR=1 FL=1